MSARTHTQRCPSRTSAPSLSPPPPDVLICSCAHPHPPHTHPPRTALSAPSLVPPFLPHHPRPNRSVRPHRPTRLPITRRKARTNCPRPHPPCTHRPRRPTPSPRTTHTCSPSHRPCPHPSVSPLKLWDCDFPVSLQSISNFVVSLPNLSKRCEGATVPAGAALTLPRPV